MREPLPTVLIPGLLCTPLLYADQIPALWPLGPVSIANHTHDDSMADIARRVLSSAPPKFALVGLSMGGYVALELWRRHPERVAGLVLANTRSGADTPEASQGRLALAARLRAEGNVLVDAPPPLLTEDASEELQQQVTAWIADQPAEAIAAAAAGMAERPDSTPDLAGIDVPTLVITSDGDRLIPKELSAPMAEAIPGAELLVLEGVGHLSNVEAPAAFSAALRGHVSACGVEL